MPGIDITGLSKSAVLAALCNATSPQGFGYLQADGPVTEEQAAKVLSENKCVDYCFGRPIKIDFSKDVIETWGYDRDAGQGAAERVINGLRR